MKHYTHFSLEEREIIWDLISKWVKSFNIAKQLWRSASSITREIARNSVIFPKSKNNLQVKQKEDYVYRPGRADTKYHSRHGQTSWRPPLKNPRVFKYVVSKLKSEEKWSPDIIAWMIRIDYPDDPTMRICKETIYSFAYTKKWKELRLKDYFLRSRSKRRKYSGRKTKRSLIPNRIDISERPEEIEDRNTIGHWEWDSIVWIGIKSALHTELERKSRFLMVKKIPRKTAECTKKAMIELFNSLPLFLRKTSTLDNWCEFTRHSEFTEVLKMPIYFARPYHSWERGSNENANGMIRRYFPKKTDFDKITDKQIQAVVDKINNRPRKILWYKSSYQILQEHILLYSH
jgi:transposase, IS30 family